MAQIQINTFKLTTCRPDGSYAFELVSREEKPSKRYTVSTVADCKSALRQFAEELKATGKPWAVAVMFVRNSGRKPAGFDKAVAAKELECLVNPELAMEAA